MRVRGVPLAALAVLVSAAPVLGGSQPMAVSPGDPSKVLLIGVSCPTFSWAQVEGARGYEMVVYRLDEDGEEAQQVLRQDFPGTVFSWTPSLDRCPERGARYAWSVRAVGERVITDWSTPSLFEVASGPSEGEFERALAIVREYTGKRAEKETESPAVPQAARDVPSVRPVPATVAPPSPEEAVVEATPRVLGPTPSYFFVDGAIAVGAPTPLADLHVLGDFNTGTMMLAPDRSATGGDAEILLAEDDDGTYGVKLVYDGLTNVLELWGRNNDVDVGPWLTAARDSGAITFGGPLLGATPDGPCYDTSHRFVDCGNGTVTDTYTGLIWLADADCFAEQDYAAANATAAALYDGAAQDCGLSDGSRPGDWRLPFFDEWDSIMKDTCDDSPKLVGNGTTEPGCFADSPDHEWVSGIQIGSYWSAQGHGSNAVDRACTGTPWMGTAGCGLLKTNTRKIWPVRGHRFHN